MKTIDLSRLVPPGTVIREEIKRLCVGLAGATGCAVLIYGVNYRNAYDLLFDRYGVDRVLRPDAVMPPFDALSWGSLTFFYFVALGSLAAAIIPAAAKASILCVACRSAGNCCGEISHCRLQGQRSACWQRCCSSCCLWECIIS